MDILPGLVVLLASADDELVFLNGYIELVTGKTRHRQCDPKPFGLAVVAVAALDIVGRVAVGTLDDAIERTLDFVESQQERTGQRRNTRHHKVLSKRLCGALAAPRLATVRQRCRSVRANMGMI